MVLTTCYINMKKAIIIIGIIGAIALMIGLNLNKNKDESEGGIAFGGKAQEVEAVRIETGDLASSVIITGAVEEVTKRDLSATSAMEVTGLLKDIGDSVKVGDPLFSVDLTSFQEELVSLKLNREIQALQIEKIQSISTTSSSSGAKIALELAKINLNSAQSFYDNQVESLAKNEELFKEGIISQSELDSMTKSIDDAKSQIDIATLNVQRSESDLNSVYSANNNSTKSLEFDVQIQLKNLESLDLSIAKVEKQMIELEESTYSPISGVITAVHVETGDMVMTGAPLFQIMDMEDLIIKASVREYDIRNMEVGQNVVVTGDAIDKENMVTGKLSYIAPVASGTVINGRSTTGIEIKISINEGLEFLKPGYTTDCEITTQEVTDVVIGTYELFREDKDNNKTVFVIVDDVLEERMIETGITADFEAEISSGLEVGDIVVVNPSLSLKEGMKVMISNDLEEVGE